MGSRLRAGSEQAISPKQEIRMASPTDRSPASAIPYDLLMRIQAGTMAYRYKGVPTLKNPFDLALYPMLLWSVRPRTIIEIGSNAGGSALWLADQLTALAIEGHVYSADLARVDGLSDPRLTFIEGDGRCPADIFPADMVRRLPRPLLVIEDADHSYGTSKAVLGHFAPLMERGEYIVVEDGILSAMKVSDQYDGGPARAIAEFLAEEREQRWEVDAFYCDYFGPNVTWNVNGYLKRVG
jgi:cephalosporin hydroxylase